MANSQKSKVEDGQETAGRLGSGPSDFDFDAPDLGFDRRVEGVLSERAQVRITSQPAEIAVAQCDSLFEGGRSQIELAVQRITAREIVEDQRVVRFEPGELLIYAQTALVGTSLSVVVSENLKRLDVPGVPPDDTLEKANLNIKIAHLFSI
ncbi:MAG: hypothetical protein C5B50_16135 [Verrucomicrobia bacterium]|nr:MAG: hypothetical protein C5B50_16135 [Verrucomicrobiota bacterium]